MKIPALILARGGSKGIPGKNMEKVAGMSLVGRCANEAVSSRFDPVYVWSDAEDIRAEGERYGALSPHRWDEVSGDKVSTEDAVVAFLGRYGASWKALAVLQCTTPFLKSDHMNSAVQMYESGKLDSVISGTRFTRYLGYPGHVGSTSFVPMRPYRALRQEGSPAMFMENGGIYLAGVHLWKKRRRIGSACGVVEMGWWESLEIDEPSDLEVARRIYPMFLDNDGRSPKSVKWVWEGRS